MNANHNLHERFGGLLTDELFDWLMPEAGHDPYYYTALNIYSFPQMWSDTACGFRGIAGQAFTKAQTTVFMYEHKAVVFIADRFAYKITHMNDHFYEDLSAHKLLGASDYHPEHYEF